MSFFLTNILKGAVRGIETGIDTVLGRPTPAQQDEQKRQMNDQIAQYKNLTSLATDQLTQAKNAQEAERQAIQEKEIRSMRSRFGASGFLDSDQGSNGDTSDLPTKLGA